MADLGEIKDISIVNYLNEIGIETRKEGPRYFCSSPFSSDRNWSFCVYPGNTYFDWSTGHGGNIINLHSRIRGISTADAYNELKDGIAHEKYKPNYKYFKEKDEFWEEFSVERYINRRDDEIAAIKEYASRRGITENYVPGVFFSRSRDSESERLPGGNVSGRNWIRNPAIMFVHVDKNLKPCGAKFRKIKQSEDRDQSVRFSARGKLGFYLLFPQKTGSQSWVQTTQSVLYVVESESSANSLWSHIDQCLNTNSVVLSMGGVSSAPKLQELPELIRGMSKKLIIDYDGNEELYQERLKLYKDLNAEPIKLILPKGEDLNSLFVKKQMYLIEHLL